MTITVTTNFDMFDDGKKHRIASNSIAESKTNENIQIQENNDSGENSFDFGDFLDVINPMQHLPVVSNIYREITGDTIQPVARVAGGAIFGGLIGVATSLANIIIQESSGKDIGEHMMAMVIDETKTTETVGPAQPEEALEQKIKIIREDVKFAQKNSNETLNENPYAVLASAHNKTQSALQEMPVINVRGRHYVDHNGNRISYGDTETIGPLSNSLSPNTQLALIMIQNLENADRALNLSETENGRA